MYILNITHPLMAVFVTMFMALLIIIGKEFKRSLFPAISLGAFIILLVVYAVQVILLARNNQTSDVIYGCITLDFVLIFVSYFAYLWIDDIEAKVKNKKSIDNSLDWFWSKV